MVIYSHVSLHEQKCCQCFRIWWEVLPIISGFSGECCQRFIIWSVRLSMFQDMAGVMSMLEVLPMLQDIVESAANISGYNGKCYQCLMICWGVLPMFRQNVESAVNI